MEMRQELEDEEIVTHVVRISIECQIKIKISITNVFSILLLF